MIFNDPAYRKGYVDPVRDNKSKPRDTIPKATQGCSIKKIGRNVNSINVIIRLADIVCRMIYLRCAKNASISSMVSILFTPLRSEADP